MTDPADWLRQFGAMQSFWNNLQPPGGLFAQPAPAWPQGWDFWRQPGTTPPPAGNDFAQGLLAQSKRYLEFLQGLAGGSAFAQDGQFDPRGWLDHVRTFHERYGSHLAGAGSAMPWFGGVDGSHIEQLVRSFMRAPGNDLRNELGTWLNLPTFGLNREQQSRGQAVVRAWLDYQVANARYSELMLTVVSRTLELLGARLDDARNEPDKRITTARGLYDASIDAAEEAFAGIAMSAEYAQVNGELINAQIRVRAAINDEIGRMAAQFGLPTRGEVDSLARQLHGIKRELRGRGTRADSAAAPAAGRQPASGKASPASVRSGTSQARPAAKRAAKPAATGKAKAASSGKRRRSAAARASAPVTASKPAKSIKPAKSAKPAKSKAASPALQLRSTNRKGN